MRTIAIIGVTVMAVVGLTACDNGSCQAYGSAAALVSYPSKGGGGGGGGHGGSGGGGHGSGEGASGHSGGEGATGAHEGESSSGGTGVHPVAPGHGSNSCKAEGK